jgi:glutamine cyclotransferase
MKKYIAVLLSLVVIACNNTNNADTSASSMDAAEITAIAAPKALNYTIQKVYPHDTSAYTQGLVWYNNRLIEGTGLKGKSVLYQMDDQLNIIGKKVQLELPYFGEGITVFDGKIYQLTWEEHKVFVYDAITLKKINTLNWPYEGWGLTHNDTSLIVSTGSSNLYYVNPSDFTIQKTLGVFNEFGYQSMLNELEYVDGKIFANIYGQNDIVVIDAKTGNITNKMDCSNLLAQAKVDYNPLTIDAGFVLNGIAYKKSTNSYFLTGKCWPVVVEVKLN